MSDDLRKYEGLFLFPASASANIDDATGLVRSYVEKHGGKLHILKKWDDRKLAYEINKQARGVYILSFFEAPGSAVEAINREVNLGDQILRCLITDASHLSAEEVDNMKPQKPAPRKKTDDDDGPTRRIAASTEDKGGDGTNEDALDDAGQVDAETSKDADPVAS
jgi:small subunit ribosomal protein S6